MRNGKGIANISFTPVCKKCNTLIISCDNYCHECGNKILSISKCFYCGHIFDVVNPKFCSNCGKPNKWFKASK
jgi:uncharacterized OB-fold protein